MPRARHRLPILAPEVRAGLDAIRTELGVPDGFPPAVAAEVARLPAVGVDARVDRRDLPLITIDPAGATDLDQALHVEAVAGGGHVVWYAIADVAAFVAPGSAIDAESWLRGVTLYAPDQRAPLHPPALSEDAASLLPGRDRPAVLWRLALDPDGSLVDTTVGRAMVRSREQLSYEEAQARVDADDPELVALAVVGRRRLEQERSRGGVSLPVPEQEVVREGDRYRLVFRASLPVESWNAQLSLLCGMAAAQLMLDGGWGLLRTLPPASESATRRLRQQARALGIAWSDGERYADVVARIDPSRSADAAFAFQATQLFRGADLLPLRPGSASPEDVIVHAAIAAPYAHVTAPLRRLGDRYATEAVLATVVGARPPDWVVSALDALPEAVRAGNQRAGALERAVVDHLEALVLSDLIGEELDAVVVDHRRDSSILQLRDPAAVVSAPGIHPLGSTIRIRVVAADPVARRTTVAVV